MKIIEIEYHRTEIYEINKISFIIKYTCNIHHHKLYIQNNEFDQLALVYHSSFLEQTVILITIGKSFSAKL